MGESDSFEEKSEFDWANGQEIALLKTLVAFANTKGGKISFKSVRSDVKLLDSARLDDFINSHVAPRISGITSEAVTDEEWHVIVPVSANPPHVIKKDVNVLVNGKQKLLARTGDIYVRHSSKSEIATHDDIHRMFQVTLAFWLSKIGQAVQTLSYQSL
jgi:predicted HTH transcriptional regulator